MKTILIVEDDRLVNAGLRVLAEAEGYRAVSAFDGVEALQMAELHAPDIIILDISLPRMDGYQILEQLRAHRQFRHTFVLVLTANSLPEDKERAMNAGASAFLVKPVWPRNIISVITSRPELAAYN